MKIGPLIAEVIAEVKVTYTFFLRHGVVWSPCKISLPCRLS